MSKKQNKPVVEIVAKDFFVRKIMPWDDQGKDGVIVFSFGNGSRMEFDTDELPEAMVRRLELHGLSQKLGDSYANMSKSRDFAGAYDAVDAVWEALKAGNWNVKGDGASVQDLAKALAKLKKCSVEQASTAIGAMDEDMLAKVKSHPEVKKVLAELRAERAAQAAKAANVPELVIPGL